VTSNSTQLNSQFNDNRPHRTHRANWPLTYAHNKTEKDKQKTNMHILNFQTKWRRMACQVVIT